MTRVAPVAIVALVVVLLAVPRPAEGCAVIGRPGANVHIESENAVIVYDAATKTEHFIRTAAFRTTSAEFGFIVPTPTKPELAESSANVFAALADITKPVVVTERRMRPIVDFNFQMNAKPTKFSAVGASMAPEPVRVVGTKKVGDFDSVTLQADDAKALRDWLSANGYVSRPELDAWLQGYIEKKWFLTAFKIAAGKEAKPDQPASAGNAAVRISFQTDTPFYPYREPAEAAAGPSLPRSLRLFVLADTRMSGTIGTGPSAKPFPGTTVWSNAAAATLTTPALTDAKLPDAVAKKAWHLTEFDDRSSPRPATDEVFFAPAADQSAVARPPTVVIEEYSPEVWPFLLAFFLLLVITIYFSWRLLRKKPT